MSETASLSDRLTAILDKAGRWRKDASVIKTLAEQAAASRAVSEDQLLKVEETSTLVYQEIAAFDALVASHQGPTELERAMIIQAGDALRLVLLEITELGTSLYAARSAWALDDGTADAPVPELARDIPDTPEPAAAEGNVWR